MSSKMLEEGQHLRSSVQFPNELVDQVILLALDPAEYDDHKDLYRTTCDIAASSRSMFRIVHKITKDRMEQAWEDDKAAWIGFVSYPRYKTTPFGRLRVIHSRIFWDPPLNTPWSFSDRKDPRRFLYGDSDAPLARKTIAEQRYNHAKLQTGKTIANEKPVDHWRSYKDRKRSGSSPKRDPPGEMRLGFSKRWPDGPADLEEWKMCSDVADERLKMLKALKGHLDVAGWCFVADIFESRS